MWLRALYCSASFIAILSIKRKLVWTPLPLKPEQMQSTKILRLIPSVFPPHSLINNFLSTRFPSKYLGIHLNNNLSWSMHIRNIVSKSNKYLGYLTDTIKLAHPTHNLSLIKHLSVLNLNMLCLYVIHGKLTIPSNLSLCKTGALHFILLFLNLRLVVEGKGGHAFTNNSSEKLSINGLS